MSNVKGFKLTSGEELICQYHKSDVSGIHLIENPTLLQWEFHPNGVPTYDLMPWAYASPLAVPIPLSVFGVTAGPYNIRDGIVKKYSELIEGWMHAEEVNQAAIQLQKTTMTPRVVSTRKR